jgi:hypothetical protein
VELPSRLLKQRMDDLAPILRQRGVDGTARTGAASSSSSVPTGVRGKFVLEATPVLLSTGS